MYMVLFDIRIPIIHLLIFSVKLAKPVGGQSGVAQDRSWIHEGYGIVKF